MTLRGLFVTGMALGLGLLLSARATAAINASILSESEFPSEAQVLTFDPNDPLTPDGAERDVKLMRNLTQTFRVAETFDLGTIHLLYVRGTGGMGATIRIFPVEDTLGSTIQPDFDLAVQNGFLMNQSFVMPPTDFEHHTLQLELTEPITLEAAEGAAGYGILLTPVDIGPDPGPFTWKMSDGQTDIEPDDLDGPYDEGRVWYDDFTTGGATRLRRDFSLALSGAVGPPPVAGDTDGDGIGGEFPDDFDPIRDNFRTTGVSRAMGDLTGDGLVNFADFQQWKTVHLGGGGSLAEVDLSFVANVPEPSSIALVMGGFALAGLGRWIRTL